MNPPYLYIYINYYIYIVYKIFTLLDLAPPKQNFWVRQWHFYLSNKYFLSFFLSKVADRDNMKHESFKVNLPNLIDLTMESIDLSPSILDRNFPQLQNLVSLDISGSDISGDCSFLCSLRLQRLALFNCHMQRRSFIYNVAKISTLRCV